MEDIVKRVADNVGIGPDVAEKAVKIILELVREHAPADQVSELFDKLPGAETMVDEAPPAKGGGGLMGALGGLGGLGGAMGAMGALNKMQGLGLSMDQVQAVSKEVLDFSREHAGEELTGKVVASIPGLSQFV